MECMGDRRWHKGRVGIHTRTHAHGHAEQEGMYWEEAMGCESTLEVYVGVQVGRQSRKVCKGPCKEWHKSTGEAHAGWRNTLISRGLTRIDEEHVGKQGPYTDR
jgi:hypothetical protein